MLSQIPASSGSKGECANIIFAAHECEPPAHNQNERDDNVHLKRFAIKRGECQYTTLLQLYCILQLGSNDLLE